MLEISSLQTTYLKKGSRRHLIEISHGGLKKHQLIKGEFPEIVQQKARLKPEEWNGRWEKLKAK